MLKNLLAVEPHGEIFMSRLKGGFTLYKLPRKFIDDETYVLSDDEKKEIINLLLNNKNVMIEGEFFSDSYQGRTNLNATFCLLGNIEHIVDDSHNEYVCLVAYMFAGSVSHQRILVYNVLNDTVTVTIA